MNTADAKNKPSHLFTVRIWQEQMDDQQIEWRGTVRHVLNGETHHFREWAALIQHLEAVFTVDPLDISPEKGKDK